MIICKKCGKEKSQVIKGFCINCYMKNYIPPLIICKKCGKEKPHTAKGLCSNCYNIEYKHPLIICKKCGKIKSHEANGLCHSCYVPPLIICKKCGKEKPNRGKHLCLKCYRKQYIKPLIICKRCGKKRPHAAKGVCKKCYKNPLIICKRCGKKRPHNAYGLCITCRQFQREKTDINYKIRMNLSVRTNGAILNQYGKKAYGTIKLLGCTIQECRKHIENQWEKGMSWSNHRKYGWHIDHIIPCASFNLTKESEQLKCFHYTNLQPLWWEDNLKKGCKL